MKTLQFILFISLIISAMIISGCSNTGAPVETSTPSKTVVAGIMEQAPSSTATVTRRPPSSPTPSTTLDPTPSDTPLPTLTPTITPTPAPVVISPVNIDRLQREGLYELPIRGQLREARWSQDGKLVLVTTETGTYLLDGTSLEPVHFFPGMSPLSELDGGRWLVWAEGKRQFLSLEGNQFRFLPVPAPLDKAGADLVALSGEVAVRKTGDTEIEIVLLKDGSRRSFNIRAAGYSVKSMRPLAISPNGKLLIIQDTYWFDIYVVNLESLEVAYQLSAIFDDPIFSPDGQYISFTDSGGIKVVKAINGIQYNRFSEGFIIRPTPKTYIYYGAVAYDYLPDNQHLGVVYCIQEEKCELYIWSMLSGQAETIVKELPAGVQKLDFTADGKSFLTIASDGIIRTWSLESQSMISESQPYDRGRPVTSPDGKLAAIPRGSQIVIFNVETRELWKSTGDYRITSELRVDAITENYLMVAGYDRSTGAFEELWDLASGTLVRKFNPLSYPNFYSNEPYCKRDTDASLIACGSNPLQIFDALTGVLLVSNKSKEGYLEWAISLDGNLLATCTVAYVGDSYEVVPGGQIYLLDLTTPSLDLVTVLEGPQGKICSPMVFSPDSQSLAAQSGYIWRIGQQQPQASFSMNGEAPMAFNPDGSLLVVGNWIIRTDTGKKLAELEVNGAVEMIGFDADGYELVLKTGAEVEIWSVGGE